MTDHSDLAKQFADVVNNRRSVRAFRPDALPRALIEELLELASQAPSNANTQPWRVEVLSGTKRNALSARLLEVAFANELSADIAYLTDQYPAELTQRRIAHLTLQQAAFGVERSDSTGRRNIIEANFSFFGAPHVALLFLPQFANEREAADVGHFAQTFMLALTARGLASCPQTAIGLFAQPVHQLLEIGDDYKLLYAISFGYEETTRPESRFEQSREPLDHWAHFHD